MGLQLIQSRLKTSANKAYSLSRVNPFPQGFRFVASSGDGGQESASKSPQAICKLYGTFKMTTYDTKKLINHFDNISVILRFWTE